MSPKPLHHPLRTPAAILLICGGIVACSDIPTALTRPAGGARHSEGGTVEMEPIVAVACGSGWTGTYPDCVPPGGWLPGGSAPGDYTYNSPTGGTSSSGVAAPEGQDGPILALIVCLVGMGASGFTIYDVWDQARDVLQDRADMIVAEDRARWYMQQITSEAGGDQTLFELYLYEAEQARAKYVSDVHELAKKLHMSEFTLGASIVGCAASLAAPTP